MNTTTSKQKDARITQYDENWPHFFNEEAKILKPALGDNFVEIYHIGSTVVPGLASKPVIDIMVIVKDANKVDTQAIERLGYEFRGEISAPLHQYFTKKATGTIRSYHLHTFEQDNALVSKILAVRNYFINHKEAAEAYTKIKTDISQKCPEFGMEYLRNKLAFLDEIWLKTGLDEGVFDYMQSDKQLNTYQRLQSAQDPLSSTELLELSSSEGFHPQFITYTIQNPSKHFYLIYHKATGVIGVAHMEFLDEHKAAIKFLAIDKPFKGQNYEKEILIFIEKWAVYHKKSIIQVQVTPQSQDFYKSLGYNLSSSSMTLEKHLLNK